MALGEAAPYPERDNSLELVSSNETRPKKITPAYWAGFRFKKAQKQAHLAEMRRAYQAHSLAANDRSTLLKTAQELARAEGVPTAFVTFLDGTVIRGEVIGVKNPEPTIPSMLRVGGILQLVGVETGVTEHQFKNVVSIEAQLRP
jgi:hypothetical protein